VSLSCSRQRELYRTAAHGTGGGSLPRMSEPPAPPRPPERADRLRLAPDVRFRVVVEEGVVLRQRSAEVLVVNEVGARVLALIDPSRTVAQVLLQLEEEFDVERTVLEADVAAFLAELVASGVVERAPAAAP